MTIGPRLVVYLNLRDIAARVLSMPYYKEKQDREDAWDTIRNAGTELRACFGTDPELLEELPMLIEHTYLSAVVLVKIAQNRPTKDFPEKPSPVFLRALEAALEGREGGARLVLEQAWGIQTLEGWVKRKSANSHRGDVWEELPPFGGESSKE